MTLFKLTDFISSRRSSHIVNNTLLRAYPTLLYMIWTILIVATLMSSIIFLTERGDYTVNHDYPHGAYLRPDLLHSSKEESPFKSVLVSMYYVLVTMTSTGYGDLYCTSALGRFLSNILMCSAVLIMALPIAVLGNILSEEVNRYLKRKEERHDVVEKQLKIGRKLPVYKYRRGPSLLGAKEMVGQTMSRLSSISLLSQTTSQRHHFRKAETYSFDSAATGGAGGGGGGGGYDRTSVPSLRRQSPQKRRKSSTPDLSFHPIISSSSSSRRGSDACYEQRRLSQSTLEKVRKLSVNSLVQFVETQQQQQNQDPPPRRGDGDGDEYEGDDFETDGIVLNPINSPSLQTQRPASLTKLFQSDSTTAPPLFEYFQSSPSLPSSRLSSSPSPSTDTSKGLTSSSKKRDPMFEIHMRLKDIENQIESYSNSYQDRMKECLDLYHQIQIQMKIRNDLLKSLSKDCNVDESRPPLS
jgi:hypothetical protein